MNQPSVKYEPCDRCSGARAENDYKRALACRLCKGTGYAPAIGETPCNGCGGTMASGTRPDDRQVPQGIYQYEISGDYDSPALSDMTTYTFSMCEHCLRTWFEGCKVPPKTERYDLVGIRPNELEDYAADHESYKYQQWKENLGYANAHLHGICNQTRSCGKPAKWTVALSESLTDHCLCDDHKDSWSGCTNGAIVPFVPDALWSSFRRVNATGGETDAPPTPPAELAPGEIYTIDGNLPEYVAEGLMAVLWDSKHTRVRASVTIRQKATTFLRVTLGPDGVTAAAPLPDLRIKTPGFRRRDPQLQTWFKGALSYACYRGKGLEIVAGDGWRWENRTAAAEDELEDNPLAAEAGVEAGS
jgi:hypothetical protein